MRWAALAVVAVSVSLCAPPLHAAGLHDCAPNVAPQTIAGIIDVESKGNPLVIHVNGLGRTIRPASLVEAIQVARHHIAKGRSVDLGLMQVNSSNLGKLGYSVAQMFEPCSNVEAGGRVLSAFYARALRLHGDPQQALLAALSAYNTGSFTRGFRNGYVGRYFGPSVHPAEAAKSPEPSGRKADQRVETLVYRRKDNDMSSTDRKLSRQMPVISRDPGDAKQPGIMVEYSREEAARLGAFEEDALSEADAWEANLDLADDGTAIVQGGAVVAGEHHGQD